MCCVSCADNWSTKAIGRKTTGTGRMRYLKTLTRRFKNGFREGVPPLQNLNLTLELKSTFSHMARSLALHRYLATSRSTY